MPHLPNEIVAEILKYHIADLEEESATPWCETVRLCLVSKTFQGILRTNSSLWPSVLNLGAINITSQASLLSFVHLSHRIRTFCAGARPLKHLKLRLTTELNLPSGGFGVPWAQHVFPVRALLAPFAGRPLIVCQRLDLECDYVWQWETLFDWGRMSSLSIMTRAGNLPLYSVLQRLNPALLTSLTILAAHEPAVEEGAKQGWDDEEEEGEHQILDVVAMHEIRGHLPRLSFPKLAQLTIVNGHEDLLFGNPEGEESTFDEMFHPAELVEYIHAPALEELTLVQTPWNSCVVHYLPLNSLLSMLCAPPSSEDTEKDTASQSSSAPLRLRPPTLQDTVIFTEGETNGDPNHLGLRALLTHVHSTIEEVSYAPFSLEDSGLVGAVDTEFLGWLYPTDHFHHETVSAPHAGSPRVPRWLPRLRSVEVAPAKELTLTSQAPLDDMFAKFLEERQGRCEGSVKFYLPPYFGCSSLPGSCGCRATDMPGTAVQCTAVRFPVSIHSLRAL